MVRFNDFSRFKNNELRSYFVKKELNEYLEKKKKDNSLRNPIIGAIFSAITLSIFWSAKDVQDEIVTLISGYENYYYFIIVSGSLFLFGTLFYLYKFIVFVFSLFINFLSKLINTFFFVNGFNFFNTQSNIEKEKLDIFKYEIANQISLALSIVTHIESTEDDSLINENKFYANEAFHYLTNSLEKLDKDLIRTVFIEKIKDKEYLPLNYNRIKDLLDLAKDIKERIELYWDNINVKGNYKNESNRLDSLLNRIQANITVN